MEAVGGLVTESKIFLIFFYARLTTKENSADPFHSTLIYHH
jgi:hypothetical protein